MATAAEDLMQQVDEDLAEAPGTPEAYLAATERLHAPFEKDEVRLREGAWNSRTQTRDMYPYVPWFIINDRLDVACPIWQYTIKSIQFKEGQRRANKSEKDAQLDRNGWMDDTYVIVVAAVDIYGVIREGVGMGMLSDGEAGIKGAESDALKRAAVKHGVARDEVYGEDVASGTAQATQEQSRQYQRPAAQTAAPQEAAAKTLAELMTPAQKNLLERHAREAGVDLAAECLAAAKGTPIDKISKKTASYLIDHFREIIGGQRAPLSAAANGGASAAAPARVQELPGTQVNVRQLKASGDRLGDFIMHSQDGKNVPLGESVPDIERPFCDCKPPAVCRWVAGKKADGNTSFGMFCCSYPRKDSRNCGVMFNKRGERVSAQ